MQLPLLAMQRLAAGLHGCVRRPACKTTGASRVSLLPQPSCTRGVGLIPAAVGVEDSERRGAMSQPVNHTHTELLTHSIDSPFPNWRAAAGIFSSPTLAAHHTRTHTYAVCPTLWCVKSGGSSERNTNSFTLRLLIAL